MSDPIPIGINDGYVEWAFVGGFTESYIAHRPMSPGELAELGDLLFPATHDEHPHADSPPGSTPQREE